MQQPKLVRGVLASGRSEMDFSRTKRRAGAVQVGRGPTGVTALR